MARTCRCMGNNMYSHLKFSITKPVSQLFVTFLYSTHTRTHTCPHTLAKVNWVFNNTCVHRGVSEVRRALLRIIKWWTEQRWGGEGEESGRKQLDLKIARSNHHPEKWACALTKWVRDLTSQDGRMEGNWMLMMKGLHSNLKFRDSKVILFSPA